MDLCNILLTISVLSIIVGLIIAVVYLAKRKENFTTKEEIKKFYKKKGAWDQSFYEHKIPFEKVKPKNTECELLDRFYGGNKILQFNEYLAVIEKILEGMSEHRNLEQYQFGKMKTSELCNFNVDEERVKQFLTKKLNEVEYNKILYDNTCEKFVVQEPKMLLSKCPKTGAILIEYHFVLYNPKRESSINSVAIILIDEDSKFEIVDAKSATQFSGEYNGYCKHTSKNCSPWGQLSDIPLELCSHRHLDKFL